MSTHTAETPKRQAFLNACAPWTKIGLTDFFIRGYDDRQCGRNHAFVGATVAGDAYRAGWNAYTPASNADKVADALGRPGDVPSGYDRSDWNA